MTEPKIQHEAEMDQRVDLGQGAWFSFDREWLSESEADLIYEALYRDLNWVERSIIAKGKSVWQPRLMSWAGELPYLYSGQVLEPVEMHPILEQLRVRLTESFGLTFNHVVANLYRNGEDRVGFHADDEPELGYEPLIASLSLGVSRRFVMKHKYKSRKKSLNLRHGSLLVMGGSCQHKWYHAVPAQPEITGARINLTYRVLRGEPGWRAPREEDPRQSRRAPSNPSK